MRGPTATPSSMARFNPNTGTAHVAYGGETPHQGRFGLSRGQQVEVAGIGGQRGPRGTPPP